MLYRRLHIAQISTAHKKGSGFGQRNAPLTIDNSEQPLRNSPPKIDLETVTRTEDVVRSDRKVHRDGLRVTCNVSKNLQAKALDGPLVSGCLHVHVEKRWNIGVWIRPVNHSHRGHILITSSSARGPCGRGLLHSVFGCHGSRVAAAIERNRRHVATEWQAIDRRQTRVLRAGQRVRLSLGGSGSQLHCWQQAVRASRV